MSDLAVLNTSIVTADGAYILESITTEQAVQLAAYAELDSAVGHDSTAQILTTILGREVPVNRQLFVQAPGQQALVFKLGGRPEPGRELSREELEEIGFSFKLLTRATQIRMPADGETPTHAIVLTGRGSDIEFAGESLFSDAYDWRVYAAPEVAEALDDAGARGTYDDPEGDVRVIPLNELPSGVGPDLLVVVS